MEVNLLGIKNRLDELMGDMTEENLSELLDWQISPVTIKRMRENKNKTIKLSDLKLILNFFDKKPNDFFVIERL